MTYNEGKKITWEEFHQDTKNLCKKIKNSEVKIKGIVAITRGGLVPTGIIGSELNIKNIERFSITSYSDKEPNQSKLEILGLPTQALKDKGKEWLIVDDLTDTGETFAEIKKHLPQGIFATVYTKTNNNEVGIHYYEKYFEPNTWIFFPWSVYDFTEDNLKSK